MKHHHSDHSGHKASWTNRLFWIIPIVLIVAVATYFTSNNYWSGLGSNWFFLIMLLCPLMHLFMHNGHKHGGQVHVKDKSEDVQ